MIRKALFAALLSCAVSSVARGAEGTAPEPAATPTDAAPRSEPYRLGEIVVSGRSANAETGQTSFVIPLNEIEATGARTLDQALATTPGLFISPGNMGVPRIFLRGLPPRHTPLYLNGVPINSAFDGQFDPSLIPADVISEVKVIEGNSSVLYGPGTTGGVIDIVTKKGTSALHADAWAEFGSGPSWLQSADMSGPLGTGSIFLSGMHQSLHGFPLSDGSTRSNSDKDRGDVFANVTGSSGDWSIGVTATNTSADQGIPPGTLTPAQSPFAMQQIFERLNDIEGHTAQIDIGYDPNGPLKLRFTGFVNQLNEIDDRYDNANFNSMSNPTVQTFHQLIDSLVSGGQSQAIYDFGTAGSLAGVAGLRREELSLGGTIRNIPLSGGGGGGGGGRGGGGGGGQTFGVRTLNSDDVDDTYWIAAEYNVSPLPRTHFIAGAGEDWFTRGGVSAGTNPQWMTGLGYDLASGLRADVSYSRKVRYPTVQELFDAQKGNPTLHPEQADGVEAQISWSPSPTTNILLVGFRNDVRGFIQNDNLTQVFTNKDELVNGFQIAGRAQLTPQSWMRAGYTFTDTVDKTTGVEVNFRPRHIVNLEGNYAFLPNWAFYARASLIDDQVVSSNVNPVVQEHLPDFLILNARLSYLFPAQGLTLYVEADNFLDARYIYTPGFPAAGRTVFVGAQFRY